MSAVHLGFYNTSGTRTKVRFPFSTHAAAGGNVAPSSAFEAADLRIYKAADSTAFSATERSSANGITMTSPFDTTTGFHTVTIDLTDDTDAGFYAAGCLYAVTLAPDETIDSQTLTGVVLAYFEIGPQPVEVDSLSSNGEDAIENAVTAAITALNLSTLDDIGDEVDTRMAAIRLDELLAADSDIDGAAPPAVGSVFHELMSKTAGSFTFDQTTDSMEAIGTTIDTIWQAGGSTGAVQLGDVAHGGLAATLVLDQATIDALVTANGDLGVDIESILTVVTNTNQSATLILADTNELQSDWANGGRLDLILDARASQTSVDDLPTNSELSTALGSADDAVLAAIAALNNVSAAQVATAVLTTAMTEAYRSAGATATLAQFAYEVLAHLGDSSISGTTKTLKKLDGTTAKTFTLDSATTPTSITEAT